MLFFNAGRFNVILLALVLSVVAWASGQAQQPPSWPRFLGENFDGVAIDPGVDWSRKPEFLWSLAVGDGYGIGTVAEGKYFQFDAGVSPRGQSAERLRCLDLSTGKTLWSKTSIFLYSDLLGYEDGPRSSPTIAGDHVYTLGVAGKLTCRDVSSGEEKWSLDTNEKYGVVQNFFGVGCSPLVLDDKLIVMIGGSPPGDQDVGPMRLDRVSPNGSALVAFDRETGKEIWKCGDDLASYSSPRPIELDGKIFLLAFAREGLMLIDPIAGKVQWRFDHRASKLESVNAMVPVVVGDHVLISECYEVGSALLKVSAKEREVVWQDSPARRDLELSRQSFRSHWATPLVIDGFLYGGSGRNAPDSSFRCVDFMTGEVQWSDERSIRSTATRLGDHLLVLEERGKLQVVRPNREKLDVVAQWDLDVADGERPALRYPCWAAPIVVGNKLIVRGTDNVVCLELAL